MDGRNDVRVGRHSSLGLHSAAVSGNGMVRQHGETGGLILLASKSVRSMLRVTSLRGSLIMRLTDMQWRLAREPVSVERLAPGFGQLQLPELLAANPSGRGRTDA